MPNFLFLSSFSGLTHESHKKDVEQVYLRCSEGSIEWMYPTGALIVNLRPNTSPASYKHLTVCIKPFKDSAGANIYLEKTGELKLLVRDGERSPSKVYCFGYDQGGLFVEATPQQDISRKITGFQYELMNKGIASDLHTVSGEFWDNGHIFTYCIECVTDGGVSEWESGWVWISCAFKDMFYKQAIAEELIFFFFLVVVFWKLVA